jgi:hypothetical protein
MTLLNPDLVAAVKRDPDLHHEGKVAALAMVLIYQEGGPIAEGLSALAQEAPSPVEVTLAADLVEEALEHTSMIDDPDSEQVEQVEQVERVERVEQAGARPDDGDYAEQIDAYLRSTLAWSAVEQLLDES